MIAANGAAALSSRQRRGPSRILPDPVVGDVELGERRRGGSEDVRQRRAARRRQRVPRELEHPQVAQGRVLADRAAQRLDRLVVDEANDIQLAHPRSLSLRLLEAGQDLARIVRVHVHRAVQPRLVVKAHDSHDY